MLQRTLEPEVMDAAEEARVYEEMDHQPVNQCFVDDLIAFGPVGPRVVDLGCGPAQIPILLCRQLESVTILGVDLSIEMLERAKREVDIAGLLDRIQLEQDDIKVLSGFEDAMADTVISNTVLHHLASPADTLAVAVRLAKPGGRIFMRDLYRPETEDEVESLVRQHAGEDPVEAQQLLRQSLHASLTLDEIRELCSGLGIEADHVQMTSDRHWTLDWTRPN